jgi:uncharacterized protein YbjT (DUF2867 family)
VSAGAKAQFFVVLLVIELENRAIHPNDVTFLVNSVYYKYRARYLCLAEGIEDEQSHCSHHAHQVFAVHHRRLDLSLTYRDRGLCRVKVAVIGGTGFVGGYVIEALTAAGHDVSVLVRAGSEKKLRHASLWRTTSGDLNDDTAIDATLTGCDAVIYSVGLLREFPRQQITYENTQYEGVVRVVASAQRNDVNRFLLLSANGIKMPGTPYQETKFRAEEHLAASGLDATIFRPSVIFGDPHGTMEFATQLHRDMVASPLPAIGFYPGLRPGKRHILMSPAYAGDVAMAISNCLEQDTTIGNTYTLGGPDVLSWQEMIRRIAAAVGRKKWVAPMPIELMKLAATLLDWLPFFPVTRDQLIMLAENNVADPGTLEQLAGRPLTTFDVDNLSYLNH